MAPLMEHPTVDVDQFKPAPPPAGKVSSITTLLAVPGPLFVTTIVNVAFCPGWTVPPSGSFTIDSVGSGQVTLIVIGPDELLLPLVSPSLVTTAVFWMLGQSPIVVVRVNVRLNVDPAVIDVAVHVTNWVPEQLSPVTVGVEVGPVMVHPAPGNVSLRVTLVAVPGPLFVTVIV
jgi:hypothetical protein